MHDLTARFRDLHAAGCFVIPNPWDIGSAKLLVQLGFPALATTSSGFAWSIGRQDNHVPLEAVLAHLRVLSAAVDVPINADFEGGFAVAPEEVAKNVAAAAKTGIAGLSIEDSTHDAAQPLFDFELAVERIRAARAATDLVLVARTEGYIAGRPDLDEVLRRLTAYAAAGADCLYAPGVRKLDEIRTIVEAVAPKPVNVLVSTGFTTLAELRDLGVRRISVGGALARSAWTGFVAAAEEIAKQGTFTALGKAISGADLNARFSGS